MGQRPPSIGQIAIAVAFAFSCFGLLLFLWSTFGGPVPLSAQGYRVKVPVSEAAQLAVESDVRISSVSVGKVKAVELEDEGPNRDLAIATLELEPEHSPLPSDTRAMLRQKTLLGEAYVELTPGSSEAEPLEEGATLPNAQVSDAVQLDEIFRAFDSRTRDAFRAWMEGAALATAGRGDDLSAAIANLEPFAEDASDLLRVLESQDEAVSKLVKNTGVVFGALSERRGQLRGLIQNAGTVFATTAERDDELREAFVALPTFLDESRFTLERLDRFAADTNPLITQLRPSARQLSGTLRQVSRVSPELRGFFAGFRKLARRSKKGLPALRALLRTDLPPLLTQTDPFLRELTPIVTTAARYRREITGFLGNVTVATNTVNAVPESNFQPVHYLRTISPLSPEAVAVFADHRLRSNRANPYQEPGGALKLASGGLEIFPVGDYCTGPPGVIAELDPNTPLDPDFASRATLNTPQELFDNLRLFAFSNQLSTATLPAPPCREQDPQPSVGDISETTDYLHVYEDD